MRCRCRSHPRRSSHEQVAELKTQLAELQTKLAESEAQLRASSAALQLPADGARGGRGGTTATAYGNAAGAKPPPPLTDTQRAALALALEELANDKSVLLDRLEALTGQPQGGPWEGLPPTPPGLNLPRPRPQRRTAGGSAGLAPEKALRTVMRIATLGHAEVGAERLAQLAKPGGVRGAGAGGPGGGALGDAPEAVVQAVRRMRAERDEMRRRDHRLRSQLAVARERLRALEPFVVQQDAVDECCQLLEDLMGPTPSFGAAGTANGKPRRNRGGKPARSTGGSNKTRAAGGDDDDDGGGPRPDTVERLREGVEAVVLLSSELSSLQRQLHTSMALQRAAERRAEQLEELLRHANERASMGMTSPPPAPVLAPPPHAAAAKAASPPAASPPAPPPAAVAAKAPAPVDVAATSAVKGTESAGPASPTKPAGKGFFSSLFGSGGGSASAVASPKAADATVASPKPPTAAAPPPAPPAEPAAPPARKQPEAAATPAKKNKDAKAPAAAPTAQARTSLLSLPLAPSPPSSTICICCPRAKNC